MRVSQFLTVIMLSACCIQVHSQQFQVKNILWGAPESRIIYIGVQNPFVIVVPKDNHISVTSDNAKVLFVQDTMSITPRTIGATDVTIATNEGKKTIRFDAQYLPSINPSILEDKNGGTIVTKKEVLDFARLDVNFNSSTDQMKNLFNITRYKIQLGEKTYEHTGNTFDKDLTAAINSASSGDTMIVTEFSIKNKFSGSSVTIASNASYSFK